MRLCDEFRLPLLVSSRAGYQNLCRLITKMKLRAQKDEGAAHEEEIEQYSEGLICLTGGDDGPLAQALKAGGIEAARHSVERLIHIFGRGNVYVELQRHFHREQEVRNRAAIEIARSLHLPLLATNGVRYATPGDRQLADVFTALRNHCTLNTAGRLLARNSECHLKSPAGDEISFCRSARSHRQYRRTFFAPRIHPRSPRIRIPQVSRARRRKHDVISARTRPRRISFTLRLRLSGLANPRPPPDRTRTHI